MESTPSFDQPLDDGKYDPAKFPFQFSQLAFSRIVMDSRREQQLLRMYFGGYFASIPYIGPETDIELISDKLIELNYEDDFTWSCLFHPEFFAALMYNGYLIIGSAYPHVSPTHKYEFEWCLPKLHVERCIIDWSKFKIPKNVVKYGSKFQMTINRDYQAVLKGCIRQHSDAWLYPKMRKLLHEMHQTNDKRKHVQLHSIEVWMKKEDMVLDPRAVEIDNKRIAQEKEEDAKKKAKSQASTKTGSVSSSGSANTKSTTTGAKKKAKTTKKTPTPEERRRSQQKLKDDHPDRHPSLSNALGDDYYLVAGELGVTVGSSYISLTGFRNQYISHCGTVQLYALGNYLLLNGYTMWDFGMAMQYKLDMGAGVVSRKDFVQEFRDIRNQDMPMFVSKLDELSTAEQQLKEKEEQQRVTQMNKKIEKDWRWQQRKLAHIKAQDSASTTAGATNTTNNDSDAPVHQQAEAQKQHNEVKIGSEGSSSTAATDGPELVVANKIPDVGVNCRELMKIKPTRPAQRLIPYPPSKLEQLEEPSDSEAESSSTSSSSSSSASTNTTTDTSSPNDDTVTDSTPDSDATNHE